MDEWQRLKMECTSSITEVRLQSRAAPENCCPALFFKKMKLEVMKKGDNRK